MGSSICLASSGTEFETATQETLERLEQAWSCADEKDECEVRLEGLERNFWVGSEVGRIGGYEFQGAVFGIDGVRIYMQALHAGTRQTEQTVWDAACKG